MNFLKNSTCNLLPPALFVGVTLSRRSAKLPPARCLGVVFLVSLLQLTNLGPLAVLPRTLLSRQGLIVTPIIVSLRACQYMWLWEDSTKNKNESVSSQCSSPECKTHPEGETLRPPTEVGFVTRWPPRFSSKIQDVCSAAMVSRLGTFASAFWNAASKKPLVQFTSTHTSRRLSLPQRSTFVVLSLPRRVMCLRVWSAIVVLKRASECNVGSKVQATRCIRCKISWSSTSSTRPLGINIRIFLAWLMLAAFAWLRTQATIPCSSARLSSLPLEHFIVVNYKLHEQTNQQTDKQTERHAKKQKHHWQPESLTDKAMKIAKSSKEPLMDKHSHKLKGGINDRECNTDSHWRDSEGPAFTRKATSKRTDRSQANILIKQIAQW